MRVLSLAMLVTPASAGRILDVTDFGAKGDGSTVNTEAFRKATAAAQAEAAKGPVTVLVPAGAFVTGAFNLTSRTTLEIQEGGSVVGAADKGEYPIIPPLPSYGSSRDVGYLRYQSLVYATGSDIKILGPGTLDGNGQYWWDLHDKKKLNAGRPRLVEFYNCTGVEVGNVLLKDSGFWTLHPVYSRDVWIHDVNITAAKGSKNTDGIDPDSSQNVLIERCRIDTHDDHIAIKSGLDAAGRAVGMPSKNITIRNNLHLQGSGVSIGSEVSGGVEDVFVSDIMHVGPSKHGFHIKTSKSRGGYVRNVWFTNSQIGEVYGDAVLGILTSYGGGTASKPVTNIRDIHFVNITRTPGAPSTSKGPGIFGCFEEDPCQNVTFSELSLEPVGKSWSCGHMAWTSGDVDDVSPSGLSSCMKGSSSTAMEV